MQATDAALACAPRRVDSTDSAGELATSPSHHREMTVFRRFIDEIDRRDMPPRAGAHRRAVAPPACRVAGAARDAVTR
jgi:hypothetical protein